MIETERWEPSLEDPRMRNYVGQRVAREVFEELRQRLEHTGYLPDEYFLLDSQWENGREIPKGADVFCTTDYGGSEGIYLDVYLKWHEDGKPITKSFITGKTLGESGDDMDRMFLISSAITKAFHGDGTVHARYIKLGESPVEPSGVFHFTPEERKTVIDALIAQHNQYLGLVAGAENLLRRMTGGITQYIDQMGRVPLQLSDYDRAALAVRDGNLAEFSALLPQVLEHGDELLGQTAGRAGEVGRKMTVLLMDTCGSFESASYLSASRLAVRTGDAERLRFLMDQAESHVPDMEPGFVGRMIQEAYAQDSRMGREMIQHAAPEWIASAPAKLMLAAAWNRDSRAALTLAEKGLDVTACAGDIIRQYARNNDAWEVELLLKQGLKIQPSNLDALKACIQNEMPGAAKLLLDRGVDYEKFQTWAEDTGYAIPAEAAAELAGHWEQLRGAQEQGREAGMGGMSLG